MLFSSRRVFRKGTGDVTGPKPVALVILEPMAPVYIERIGESESTGGWYLSG